MYKIFSFYTVLRKGKKPKKETYFESFRPDTEVSVKPGDLGVQLIPFELISEQHLEYILTLPVETLPDPLEIPLKYIIYRQDFKKFQKKGK